MCLNVNTSSATLPKHCTLVETLTSVESNMLHINYRILLTEQKIGGRSCFRLRLHRGNLIATGSSRLKRSWQTTRPTRRSNGGRRNKRLAFACAWHQVIQNTTRRNKKTSYRIIQACAGHQVSLRSPSRQRFSDRRSDRRGTNVHGYPVGRFSSVRAPTPWAHKCSGQTPILWPNGSETTWARCRCRFPFPARLNLCANLATASAEVAEATPIDGPMCLSIPLREKENSNNGKISDYDHIPMSRIAMANARIHVNYITPLKWWVDASTKGTKCFIWALPRNWGNHCQQQS